MTTPSIYKNLLIDVDGVMTDGKMYYTTEGKIIKAFGLDDHGALNDISSNLKIHFLSADKRGYEITKKRIVQDMGYPLNLVSSVDRPIWINKNFNSNESIYIGDSFEDIETCKIVKFSIAPSDSDLYLQDVVDLVLRNKGGRRAVSEACRYIKDNLI